MNEPLMVRLRQALIAQLKRLAAAFPSLVFKILNVAFSPSVVVKKLVLVSLLQLTAWALKKLYKMQWNPLLTDSIAQRMANAHTLEEWQMAHKEYAVRVGHEPLPTELQLYCRQLDEQADNYTRMMAAGDMYGLMFHLRSELQRSSTG